MNTLRQLLGLEKADVTVRLPRSVVTHDLIDEIRYEDLIDESETFREETVEDPPTVVRAKAPEPVDAATASPEEIAAYREAVQEYREAEREAEPYKSWAELTADVFYAYHTRGELSIVEDVDVGVQLHKDVLRQALATDEFTEAHESTQGDDILSAWATMHFIDKLKEVLGDKLEEQMQDAQELEEKREEIEETTVQINEIVDQGTPPEGEGGGGGGGAVAPGGLGEVPTAAGDVDAEGAAPAPSVELSDQAKQELAELEAKRDEQEERAQGLAESKPPDLEAVEGIGQAASEAEEAVEAARHRPRFGGGSSIGGADEPTYASPEAALNILRQWAENKELREMAELMGRSVKEYRYKRARRVEGRNDEVVDVQRGDDLKRTLPSELALLTHPVTEDDFLSRYVDKELLEYKTVGEEQAGKGPIVVVLDGSGSMHGERNVYARAVALTLMQFCRLEKRDFALIEFSSGAPQEWIFKAREELDGERVLDMASHFFGGGTVPLLGMQRAAKLFKESPAFRKADAVLIGDGDGSYGSEDEKIKNELDALGVRFFGIAIAGSWAYLKKYCEYVVDVHDFELTDPGEAVSELAQRIT